MSEVKYPSIFPIDALPGWAKAYGASVMLVAPQLVQPIIVGREADFLPHIVHDGRRNRSDVEEALVAAGYYDQILGAITAVLKNAPAFFLYSLKVTSCKYYSRESIGLPQPGEVWEILRFKPSATNAALGSHWALGKRSKT